MVMRLGVPVFVTPLKADVRSEMESFTIRRGKVEVRIRNTGNSHFIVQSPKIRGKNPKGEEIFLKEFAGWYLLSGIGRTYSLTIPQEVCKDLANIDATFKTERFNLSGELDVDQTMCLP